MHGLQPGRHRRTPSIPVLRRPPVGRLITTVGLYICLMALAASPLLAHGGPAEPADFDGLLWENLPRFDIDPGKVPAHFRERVQELFYDYTVTHRKSVQDMLRRCASYLPAIKRILRQEGLPTYYAYIPLAESAFRVNAMHPNSGARGLWQLMPETARAYGLRVSRTIDQRLDPIRATRAAARYLSELRAMFGRGTPLLILAAYNYGETNIYKAIIRARTRNIWGLMRKWQIPDETRDYLVKMVTMWLVVSNAHLLQLAPTPEPPSMLLPYSEITFSHTMGRMVYTERLRVPEAHLGTLPPPLTCAPLSSYTLMSILSTFPVHDACWHTVRSGETLWGIARRYALRVSALKRLNRLTGANPVIYPGQLLAVCHVPFSSLAAERAF